MELKDRVKLAIEENMVYRIEFDGIHSGGGANFYFLRHDNRGTEKISLNWSEAIEVLSGQSLLLKHASNKELEAEETRQKEFFNLLKKHV